MKLDHLSFLNSFFMNDFFTRVKEVRVIGFFSN